MPFFCRRSFITAFSLNHPIRRLMSSFSNGSYLKIYSFIQLIGAILKCDENTERTTRHEQKSGISLKKNKKRKAKEALSESIKASQVECRRKYQLTRRPNTKAHLKPPGTLPIGRVLGGVPYRFSRARRPARKPDKMLGPR